jgi:hypothetical protein
MTVTLIGGEMLLWSDLDATHGPAPAGGAALRSLLSAVSGRTLVAGPHAADLLDALASSCPELTVLVRGVADASSLEARYPGVAVLCGSLEKLAAVPAYDTVVALDGLDRLISAEADDLPWDETLAMLTGVLRASGRLLLSVENMFGLHRLVSLPGSLTDADWVVADEHDPSRPAGPSSLNAQLSAAGLSVVQHYAAYGSVLATRAVLGSPDLSGFLAATLSAAVAPTAEVLTDPRRLAKGALRNGLALELAPSWTVLAQKAPTGDQVWPDAVIASAAEVREIRLPAPDLPRGRTLEDLLLAACRRRNLPVVRELLTAWLAGPAAGVPADQVVVDPSGTHVAVAAPIDPRLVLRSFAAELIRGGYADLWPSPTTEPELTAVLAGMTGRELDPADVPALQATAPAYDVRSLTVQRDRLAKELTEARAKHDWYESMLRNREAELKRVRQVNNVLKATVPGRAATTLYGGLRAGRRAVRSVVRKTKGRDA